MKMKHEPLLNSTLGVSERIYRQLLLAYPAEFRVDFGESMLQLFRDELTDAERRRGYSGVLRLWPRMLTDLIANALRARRWQMFHAATCPALTTVWAGAEVDAEGAPTQDERYLSYVDWDTGDLALRDLASGESRHLRKGGRSPLGLVEEKESQSKNEN